MDSLERKPHHVLAVLVCGTVGRAGKHEDPLQVNPALQRSPMQTWHSLARNTRGSVRIFSCTNAPLAGLLPVALAGQWVFESQSQFARLLTCLQHVEPDLARPRHTAYLRLRPDSLVLGELPTPLLREPAQDAVYARWRYYDNAHVRGQLRDAMDCGTCDQWCECAQRKYGQVLFKTNRSDCGTLTDRVFLFGGGALPPLLRALRNYSNPDADHPSRSPLLQSDRCVQAGRMVETGFGRVLEDEGLRLLPLPFRHVLSRELQPDTPSWESKACMLAWGDEPVRCDQPCHDPSWRGNRTHVGPGPFLASCPWRGCNPTNKPQIVKKPPIVHVAKLALHAGRKTIPPALY